MTEATIFAEALELATDAERAAYLAQACAGDEKLRRRVEALLRAHASPDDLLDQPQANAATADYPITELPGMSIGPYRLMEQIGEGGFGLVFVAEQQEPVRRKVALKVIKPGMDSNQVIARFEAERQALALMDHPNIARVLDAGATESGRPYFVMELVRGIAITDYCDQNHLTPRERLELFVTVCNAIQHAHQKGIIHRDVKPNNVLVTSHDGKPVAKVIDFGVAKAIHQHLTERTIYTNFAQMIGTPLYMSPEQAEMSGLDIDTRSDIYSLGVLLYELLTGSTPLEKKRFAQAAYDEIRRLIREEEPPRPSQRLSSSDTLPSLAANRKTEPARLTRLLRGEIDWIVMKALEKDRTRRFETANSLARDLERYLADEPVEACPPSAGYRLRKFARKHRAALTTAATIAFLLVAGVAASTWQAVRATRAERATSEERDRALTAEAETRDERDRVLAEKKRADENLALAQKAVEDYLTRVTDDSELKDRTDFTSLRKRLLESALPFYERFAQQLGQGSESRAESGRIFMKLAQVRIESGELGQAVAALRQARDAYSRASDDDGPNRFPFRSAAVDATNDLAYWEMRLQQYSEANQHYSEAVRLAEQLVAEFPKEPDARFKRASVYFRSENFGEDRLADAIRDVRGLVTENPTEIRYVSLLSGALSNSAGLSLRAGRLQEADEMYQESIQPPREAGAPRMAGYEEMPRS